MYKDAFVSEMVSKAKMLTLRPLSSMMTGLLGV